MTIPPRNCSLLVTWIATLLCSPAGAAPLTLKTGDVVAFLGGTNMVRAQKAGYLETLLSHRFATARPTFRDLSWEGDTVSHLSTEKERWRKDGYGDMKPEAFGDLRKQLETIGATVIVAQFGKMELLEGLSVDAFVDDYKKLIGLLKDEGRKVVLFSPTPFGAVDNSVLPDLVARNSELREFADAAGALAKSEGVRFVDLFEPLLPMVDKKGFFDEGIHVSAKEQSAYAAVAGAQLGFEKPNWEALENLRLAVTQKHRLWNEYWRPANWKCLFGDDSKRIFSVGTVNNLPTIQEEWRRYPGLIATAEETVWKVAAGAAPPEPSLTPKPTSGSDQADLQKELAAFHLADGYEVNLFASEALGIANPLCIHWDTEGRLYVACSDVYPQVVPGEVANDRVIVLEDTDGDGAADESTLFAEGLNIPTGIEVGHGGVYVAQGTELLFLQDTDGDLVADERRVLLSGLGNGDSHQTANSLVWSPEGDLYFCQGDGIESRVETPHGVSSLFQAGVFRLRPQTMQLDGLLDDFMGPGNPWGVAFDDFGQSIMVDGAGGVSYLTPATLPVKHRLRLPRIGDPGGYCGVEYHDGKFLIGDYKPNRVSRCVLSEDGAGFKLDWAEPLIRSEHTNFRPIDVKRGPDDAVYIVDWYNPVICHQDDYFRHPDRDKIHGRIWRVSKNKLAQPTISGASVDELVKMLASENRWTRHHSKMELTRHDRSKVGKSLVKWRAESPSNEKDDYEAAAAAAFVESAQPVLLAKIMEAKEPRIRGFAARLVGRWHKDLENHYALLEKLVQDPHPLVRMESVLACGRIPHVRSVEVAAMVVDFPTDRWIEYALTQTAHHLKEHWIPAFNAGKVTFDGNENRRAAILGKAGSEKDIAKLRAIAENSELSLDIRKPVLESLVSIGNYNEMAVVLDPVSYRENDAYDKELHVELMRSLGKSRVAIEGRAKKLLHELVASEIPEIRAEALRLAGIFDVDAIEEKVEEAATESPSPVVRSAAYDSLSYYESERGKEILEAAISGEKEQSLKRDALVALTRIDVVAAAERAIPLITQKESTRALLDAFLTRGQGESALVDAFSKRSISKGDAKNLLQVLRETGRPALEFSRVVEESVGALGTAPDFDPKLIEALVTEAKANGDPIRGREIYARATMTCASCHQIDGKGGKIGPDLSAAGTTIPPARLVEEVIWPTRQVKEGFSLLQVILKDGSLALGYERTTRDKKVLQLQDFATGEMRKIDRDQISKTLDAGSSMPPGLVAQLSRTELRDLIRYLMDLGRKN
jgi:putative heme-binding domain-containing protein